MANQYLRPILDQLFGETFLHDYPHEERMRMSQSAIYLLKVTGFPLEEYSYRWAAEQGPASRTLSYDLLWGKAIPMKKVAFRKEYQEVINCLRLVIEKLNTETYSVADWLQCMTGIHYLRTYIMKWNPAINEVIDETCRRLPQFKDHTFVANAEKQLNALRLPFTDIK